jgi:hypothetical protein
MGLFTRKAVPPEEPSPSVPLPRKAKPFRIELGWRGMFGLVVVCFFLFFWMFVLGIWAGQTILLPTKERWQTRPTSAAVAPQSQAGNETGGGTGQLLRPSEQQPR